MGRLLAIYQQDDTFLDRNCEFVSLLHRDERKKWRHSLASNGVTALPNMTPIAKLNFKFSINTFHLVASFKYVLKNLLFCIIAFTPELC